MPDITQSQIEMAPGEDGGQVLYLVDNTRTKIAWLGPGAVIAGPLVVYDEKGGTLFEVADYTTYAPVPVPKP